jgi:hypothetical protein
MFGGNLGRGCAETDAAGHFCISADEEDCWFGAITVSIPDDRGGRCAGEVSLANGARPKRIALHVEDRPTADLDGRVIDEQGRAVAGASVEYRTVRWDGTECSYKKDPPVATGPDGTFKLRTRRGDVKLAVVATGYAVSALTVRNPSKGNTITVDRGASWRGRVRAPDGRALEHATLELIGGTAQPMVEGKFAIDHIDAGKHSLELNVENDPVLGTRKEWRLVSIVGQEQRLEDASFSSGLDLSGKAALTNGCVVAYPVDLDANGIPRASAGIIVTVIPDPNGHFVFHHLPAGKWTVRTCKGISGSVVAEAGRSDVVLPSEP